MNVPNFEASQTAQHVHLDVRIPSECRLEDVKVVLDASEAAPHQQQQQQGGRQEQIFGLTCPPYYLPLVFAPGTFVGGCYPYDQQQQHAVDVSRTGDGLRVSLLKATRDEEVAELDRLKAQVFPGAGEEAQRLEGLAMLQRGVEMMNAPETDAEATMAEEEATPGPAATAAIGEPLSMPMPPSIEAGTNSRLHECLHSDSSEEKKLADNLARDDDRFDEGMYMESYVDPEGEIASLLLQVDLTPPQEGRRAFSGPGAKLPVDADTETAMRSLLLILLELVVATVYDRVTTCSDPSPESGWTIATLCPVLVSSLAPSTTSTEADRGWTLDTMRLLFRRMLSRPLYRSWKLAMHVSQLAIKGLQNRPLDWLAVTKSRLTEYAESSNEEVVVQAYLDATVEPLISLVEAGYFSAEHLNSLAIDASQSLASLSRDFVGGDAWQLEALEAAADEAVASGEGGWV